MDALEEAISAECSVLNLKADDSGPVEGIIIESKKDKFKGITGTVLVQQGTLKPGDYLVCGKVGCKVKTMEDANGKVLSSAGPSTPVQVSGWFELPYVGGEVLQAESLVRKKHAPHLKCAYVLYRIT